MLSIEKDSRRTEIRKVNDLLEGVHVIHDTNVIIAAPV